MAPVFVGLTGGIAAGKSAALDAFADAGAAVVSSDALVHELLGTEHVRDALIGRWGDEVAPGGEVDRGRVAEIVFAEPEELQWLEGVMHPAVAARLAEWKQGLDPATELAVVEVPLLFETGFGDLFDATVAVIAADSTRRERAEARGHELVDERAARQLPQEEKASRASYVVTNDGSLDELRKEIEELAERLRHGDGDG